MVSNYPDGLSDTTPNTPWNPPIKSEEKACRDLHPNAAWYAAQFYKAMRDWQEDSPGLVETYWPNFNPVKAMGSILDGLDDWF